MEGRGGLMLSSADGMDVGGGVAIVNFCFCELWTVAAEPSRCKHVFQKSTEQPIYK